jgi:hypothetical protein
MMKTTTCVLIGGLSLLTLTARAQNWRVGLLGAATYDRVTENFRQTFANPGGNTIRARHFGHQGFGLGLNISRKLDDQWTLEAQPRYHRLRNDFEVRTGGIISRGHAEGGQVQLPVGARFSFGAPGRVVAPYLLGHLVLGWSELTPAVDATKFDYTSPPTTGPRQTGGMGYGVADGQLQLGLEAGAGVLLLDRLGLNLLAYYGLTNTHLATVRSDVNVPAASGPATQLTTTGTLRGHQLGLSAQGVLYLR